MKCYLMLFRKQAVENNQTRLYGQVFVATPVKFWIITAFLGAIIVGLFIFLATASFARIEAVRGAVVLTNGIVQVRAPIGGVLTEFYLNEGERVERGQQVGKIIESAAADGTGTSVGAQLAAINSKITQLNARIEQSRLLVKLDIAAKSRERVDIVNRISRSEELLVSEMALLEELRRGSERIQQLYDRNLISADAVSQQTIQVIRARQGLERLRADIYALNLQRDNIAFEQEQIHAQAKLNELQLLAERQSLQDELQVIQGIRAFDIVAPVSGTTTAILVSDGNSIDPARQVFSILPEGSTYQVELYLPSRAIGFVEIGQSVRLLLDAFPYQRFGAQSGVVAEITSSVIMPGELQLLVDVQEPVYRITVTLEESTFTANDRELALQAGMLLTANIILEERTILSWLLEPLISVSRRT
jgi:membrane fusion protein